MKIKTLNLKSYGKFENFRLDFKDGLNIIYGANGSGKSTVSTALKSFLYKELKGEGKYKKNYIPLGEKQGAYDVCFETDDNEQYETYITAGLTAAKTIHKTVKISENKEVASGCETGEYFLNTREDMYDSVCFIKEPGDFSKVSKNDKSVNENLSRSSNKERSSVDITEAIENLTKEKLSYARQTATGLIWPKEEELADINRTLADIEGLAFEESRLKDGEEELRMMIKEKKEKKLALSELSEQFVKYKEYEQYLMFKKAREHKQDIERELAELKGEKCILSESELEKIKAADSFKEKRSPLYMILMGIALAFAVMSFFNPLIFIGAALMIVASAAVFLLNRKKFKKEKEKLIEEKYRILESAGCKNLEEYYNKNYEYKQYLNKKESLERELENAASLVSKDEIKEISYVEKPAGDYAEIKKELLLVSEEISAMEVRLSGLAERRKSLYNNLPAYEELKDKKDELESEISALKFDEKVVSATLEMLNKTREKYKISYLPALSKRAEEILKKAECGVYDKLVLNESFLPSLREENSNVFKDSDYLSSGISDGVYLAIRLAVCEFAFKDREKPVLILDDPFVRMDDERAALWIKYLMSETNFQIIFLTAGKRIFNLGLENDTILAL